MMRASSAAARRALAIAGVACGAAFITACDAAGNSATPGGTVPVTTTPAGPASSSAGASDRPAGLSPCPTRDLSVTAGRSQGGSQGTYQVIDFTNISGSACTLYGYPGVAMAGGSPIKQLGKAAAEDPATARHLVTLIPGSSATALLRIRQPSKFQAAACGPENSSYLQIFPPQQTTPVYLGYSATACSKPVSFLTIDAVKPVTGG